MRWFLLWKNYGIPSSGQGFCSCWVLGEGNCMGVTYLKIIYLYIIEDPLTSWVLINSYDPSDQITTSLALIWEIHQLKHVKDINIFKYYILYICFFSSDSNFKIQIWRRPMLKDFELQHIAAWNITSQDFNVS